MDEVWTSGTEAGLLETDIAEIGGVRGGDDEPEVREARFELETVKGVPRDGGDEVGGREGKSNEAESNNVNYRGKNAKSNPE